MIRRATAAHPQFNEPVSADERAARTAERDAADPAGAVFAAMLEAMGHLVIDVTPDDRAKDQPND